MMNAQTPKYPNADMPTCRSANAMRRTACALRALGLLGFLVAITVASAQEPEQKPEPPAEPQTDKLGERLIRQAASGEGEDPMEEMLGLMDQAATNLEIKFDAGTETQALQAQVVEQLDKAIRMAAAQRRATRSRSSQFTGEKRGRRKSGKQQGDQTAEGKPGEASPAGKAAAAQAPEAAGERVKGELREVRRTWGLLPQREREEIMQGSQESFLQRYRDWIERYYEALQEAPQ